MIGLAGPSQGSQEISTWRVRLNPEVPGPEHSIDRDQVWMPVSGAFTVTANGETSRVTVGQAVLIPASWLRQVSVAEEPAEALVCMQPGGVATVPAREEPVPLPWAE